MDAFRHRFITTHGLVPGSILSEQSLMGNSEIAVDSMPGRWDQRVRERWRLLGWICAHAVGRFAPFAPRGRA